MGTDAHGHSPKKSWCRVMSVGIKCTFSFGSDGQMPPTSVAPLPPPHTFVPSLLPPKALPTWALEFQPHHLGPAQIILSPCGEAGG